MTKASEEANILWPYLIKKVEGIARNVVSGGGGAGGTGSGVPNPHALSSTYHTGTLANSQAPQFLLTNGTRDLTGNLGVSPGKTIDGVDLSEHVLDPDAHHDRVHSITGVTHTITGSAFQLVGATATNTLGLLTPSMSPGAAAAILRTDTDGSLYLDTNLLYVDAPNNRVGINRAPGAAALDVLAAANADHTLRVKQKSGQTGRLWRVEDTSGNELIVLDSQGNLQSGMPGFVSGLTGWQVSYVGNAEFNNIWARGELHATVFVKDEVHATGGTLIVATAGKLYSDAVIDAVTVDEEEWEIESDAVGFGTTWEIASDVVGFGTAFEFEIILNYIEIDDPPSGPGFYFQPYDIVRSKTEVPTGVTDFWFEIVSARQLDGYSRYSVIKHSGTDGTLPAGSAVVSYGVEGDGRILLTSDLNYAPYMDVFTVGPNPWSGLSGAIIPHVRLGRLDGVGVTGTSGIEQYGMIAGSDLSNANSPYIIASNLQLRLHKVDMTLNDGTNDTGEWTADGNLTIGTNIGADATKSFQVKTTGDDAGDLIVGQLTGNYIHWDHSVGQLFMTGSLEIGEERHLSSAGTTYGSVPGDEGGFFLGWDTDAYKFQIGGPFSNLVWNGSQFSMSLTEPLLLQSFDDQNIVFHFSNLLTPIKYLKFLSGGELQYESDFSAAKVISNGNRLKIATLSPALANNATATAGDIAIDTGFLYIATGTNSWKRVALSAY